MPRKKTDLDRRLNEIITAHVEQLVASIEEAVRQNVAKDLRAYLGGEARKGLAGGPRVARPRLIRPCIAPGCSNPSKGPRFHYLCDVHKGAARKDYEAWRKASLARPRSAAAPSSTSR